jgi:hypothetical protein
MTVSTTDIQNKSGWIVTTDYPAALFTTSLAEATAQVALDAPDLTGVLYDKAVALLICHDIHVYRERGDTKSSERMGDYGYSRDMSIPSRWIAEYNSLISKRGATKPSRGVKRADYQTSRRFQLSEVGTPEMDLSNVDNNLKSSI